MTHRIAKPDPQPSFPTLETAVLQTWGQEKTFTQSLARTASGKRFTFYDGPPFATGLPHYGHLLQGTIKDVVPRFRTMQGYSVERRFGWDTHGLPVEYELEKERGITSRQEILEMGVDAFNEACRAIVLRHTGEWQEVTERLGRWIDFDNAYRTLDPDYMESVWWVIKTLWEKELLYEGKKAMQICPRCATPLSNFEVSQAYAERTDETAYAIFPLADDARRLVAWTTTPWTLPANVLLAVNPQLTYVEVTHDDAVYIVAKDRVTATFGEAATIGKTVPAAKLIGKRYQAPFPQDGLDGKHYEVVAADAVTADEGTGILHVAPAFGEEDLAIGERERAAFFQHIDITGRVTAAVPAYQGKSALEANQPILADLKHGGRLLRHEQISHSYPHCWRCGTPLLNFATASWFVAVTKLKQRLLAENQRITWTPSHLRDGRFGKWLEGARDWSISRNRFWGNPLPIWRCPDGHLTVIGSRDELEQLSGARPEDFHKHHVDQITFDCPDCAGEAKRIPDVLDCWFESGSMPYAKVHYPFAHQTDFKESFPADFIAEGIDQTRGWFYTLHVLGVALMDSRAYDHVVTTGTILAEDGQKMSKSKQNYPDPSTVFDQYGADAIRLYLLSSPVVRGDDIRFSEKEVGELSRRYLGTLYNSYAFLATYLPKGWKPVTKPQAPSHLMDRWLAVRTAQAVRTVTVALEANQLMEAARELLAVVDDLSNWYIRRSRRRFSRTEDPADQAQACQTLYDVLLCVCKLSAPLTPFLTDYLHRALTGESVHLADWPMAPKKLDTTILDEMSAARETVRLGLAARATAKLKVRQPLAAAYGPRIEDPEIVATILAELNVKEYHTFDEAAGDFDRQARPDPKAVAAVAGSQTQQVLQDVKQGNYRPNDDGTYTVGKFELPAEAIEVRYLPSSGYVVENSQTAHIALATGLTPELRDEGIARELIRAFQELRKEARLAVTDRITAGLESSNASISRVVETHRALIATEIGARSLESGKRAGDNVSEVALDGATVTISLVT